MLAAKADTVLFEGYEHYQKMSDRNRYRISGSNNSILLTVPMVNGRDQSAPMSEIRIANDHAWQVQHWRTLVSVYNRSPYFFHYEPSLKRLFETEFTYLVDFNRAAMHWVKQQLQLGFEEQESASYSRDYPTEYTDLRNLKRFPVPAAKYYQVFEDRIGFVPGLSILDLLFSEGPHTTAWLNSQKL